MMKQIIVDQSDWGHIELSGEDRVRFLNGMLTSNVKDMAKGAWLRSMMLTHKARVISIVDVHAFADHFILSCSPDLTAKTLDTLDRHIVMDDVEIEEREMPMHTIWNDPLEVWTAAPVFAAASAPSPSSEVETRRIEAGFPRYGQDVSEANFPFESELIRLIDYKKGCFAGQEPVARVHSRGGGGNKRLCGLRTAGSEPLEVGMALSTTEKEAGGMVTSSAISETFGSIALAYVHKSAWEEGSEVRVGDRRATVSSLPFASH
jgi:folate-binding protein YgfZ